MRLAIAVVSLCLAVAFCSSGRRKTLSKKHTTVVAKEWPTCKGSAIISSVGATEKKQPCECVKSLEMVPTTQPDLFKDYSFCSPFALDKNDPMIAKIKDQVQKSTASYEALESVIALVLQKLQEQSPQFMALLKDDIKTISITEMTACLGVMIPGDVCPTMEDGCTVFKCSNCQKASFFGKFDCPKAVTTISNVFYEIGLSLIEPDSKLLVGKLVAYLHVLYEAINDRKQVKWRSAPVI